MVAVLGAVTLDDDAIAAAMDRAVTRLRADRGHPQRVTTMPSPAAPVAVDADGWAEVGVIVDPDHGHDWRVQLHVGTGAGRLRPWARG